MRYTASLRDSVVFRPGDPLLLDVRSDDGREWLVPVWSRDGRPFAIYESGGSDWNRPPIRGVDTAVPADAWEAITAELQRAWTPELAAAGFTLGVRRPRKPGAQAETWEETAIRVRRLGSDRRGNNARKLLARARREGIWARGEFTWKGNALLAEVDRAKATVVAALDAEGTIRLDELRLRLGDVGRSHEPPTRATSEMAVDAAIGDLESDQVVRFVHVECDRCGKSHLAVTRASTHPS